MLTSRPAIKAYLSTILFFITSIILLTISSTAYAFFYYNYVPQIGLERVLHLQYDYAGSSHPFATVFLGPSTLISQQAYDVDLTLDMPRTPSNLAAGNFMLDLKLLTPKAVPDALSSWLSNTTMQNVLYHSRRPAIIPYTSRILTFSHTLLHLPWHVLGFRDLDRSQLVIPMFERLTFPRGSRNLPTHARLELQSSVMLQVYDAKLSFRAKFQGLRFVIYNYRVGSFLLFTALFYTVSVTSVALGWAIISQLWSSRGQSVQKWIKQEDRPAIKNEGESATTKIRTEDETESSAHGGLSLSNVSDTPAQYPTGGGRPTLSYQGRPTSSVAGDTAEVAEDLQKPIGPGEAADDEEEGNLLKEEEDIGGRPFDSGIGTSMESEHAGLGIRRRSSKGVGRS